MINAIIAMTVVIAIGLVVLVVWPACVVSGRISEVERRQADEHAAQQRSDN